LAHGCLSPVLLPGKTQISAGGWPRPRGALLRPESQWHFSGIIGSSRCHAGRSGWRHRRNDTKEKIIMSWH
jgi:hypothetical protein